MQPLNNQTIYNSKGILVNTESGNAILEFQLVKGLFVDDKVTLDIIIKTNSLDTLKIYKEITINETKRLTALETYVQLTYSTNEQLHTFVTNSFPQYITGTEQFLFANDVNLNLPNKQHYPQRVIKTDDLFVFKTYYENGVLKVWFYVPFEKDSEIKHQIEIASATPIHLLDDDDFVFVNAGVYDIDKTVKLVVIELTEKKNV